MENKKNIYILGSGKSISNLTENQINYINEEECIISFNKYLVFANLAGIVPSHHIQIDASDLPSYYVFLKTLQRCLCDQRMSKVNFLFGEKLFHIARKYIDKKRLTMLRCDVNKKWNKHDYYKQKWADSFEEDLFHFRGTLTTAINMAHIICPTRRIRLLGVDLSTSDYFFQAEYEAERNYHDWTYQMMKQNGVHSNIILDKASGGISQEACIKWVRDQVRKTGGDLVVSTPRSYYEDVGLLDFVPLCDSIKKKSGIKIPPQLISLRRSLPLSLLYEWWMAKLRWRAKMNFKKVKKKVTRRRNKYNQYTQ